MLNIIWEEVEDKETKDDEEHGAAEEDINKGDNIQYANSFEVGSAQLGQVCNNIRYNAQCKMQRMLCCCFRHYKSL